MRQDTYRFALDEATAEFRDIVTQFEALKAKKEQIEKVVEALRPFIGLQTETPTVEASTAYAADASKAYIAEASAPVTAPEIEVAVS